MRVLVVGAGVIGVTAAWYLRELGHDVTVVETLAAPGHGASYANVGQISPALSAPWAVPGLLGKLVAWSLSTHPPMALGRVPDLEMLRFLRGMLAAGNERSFERSKLAMVRLAEYSRDCLIDLRRAITLDYEGRQRGTFVMFRDAAQVRAYEKDLAALEQLRVPFQRLDESAFRAAEPNLGAQVELAGGVHLPNDETGDCLAFTRNLAAAAVQRGVTFHYGVEVRSLVARKGRIEAAETNGDPFFADAVLLATGHDVNRLLAPHALRVPIYPVKGYSLTIAADSDRFGPSSTVSDERFKVGITNLGSHIRVGGTAELAGRDLSRREARYSALFHVVRDLFPAIPEDAVASAERWSGLRPMTPEGPPILGAMGYPNLFLSGGHGTLGWTMSCGSGRAIADLISNRTSDIDLAPFAPAKL